MYQTNFPQRVKAARDNFDIGYVQGLEDGQKRPQGKWIYQEDWHSEGEVPWRCSKCKGANSWKAPFCEHCGADMRGDEE